MRIDGITALAAILIASFVVERLSTGILFLLSLRHAWNLPDPDTLEEGPLRTAALKKRKLWNFGLSMLLGGVVIAWYGNVRLLQAIGFPDAPQVLDIAFTGLLLTAGSDRVAAIVKLPEGLGSGKKAEKPVQITGTLVLKEGSEKKLSTPA
jgi:hypothetical protein